MSFLQIITSRRRYVFLLCWITLFLLYLPAARSGFVADTTGWLDAIRHQSFADYINRSHFGVKSFYQLTQLTTWIFYQVFGASAWPWHLLHITLHAVNCLLLYTLCRGLLADSGLPNPAVTALAGVFLYCISPYHTEVIVWKASFHYLQGFLLVLAILHLARRYFKHQNPRYAWIAGLLFFGSTFSLELFYLTPWLVLSLALYYRRALRLEWPPVRQVILWFFIPELILFLLHLSLFRVVYHTGVAHLGNLLGKAPLTYYAIKPPDYFFHLFWGRFLPAFVRERVHAFFCTYAGAGLFYALLAFITGYGILAFLKGSIYKKLCSLFFCWMLLCLALVVPLWFPEKLLVYGDRYMYMLIAFFFLLLVLLVNRLRSTSLKTFLWIACALLNIALTFSLSRTWGQSTRVMDALQSNVPAEPGKTLLMLNSPACLKGVLMIGATPEGEFRLRHDLLYASPLPNRVIDVAGYNMTTPQDGGHVLVENDSTVQVMLNQPGSWWWYGVEKMEPYSCEAFRVEVIDINHSYRLILKGDPHRYQLLYQAGTRLKTVDMNDKGVLQE